MGAIMSCSLALSTPGMFRGIVVHSGYILERTHLHYRWDGTLSTEFFIAHGTDDPVIPVDLARQSRQLLESHNMAGNTTYREYPISHEISEHSLSDIAVWLRHLVDSGKVEHS
jgi:phospholipase/carboxylesterase